MPTLSASHSMIQWNDLLEHALLPKTVYMGVVLNRIHRAFNESFEIFVSQLELRRNALCSARP